MLLVSDHIRNATGEIKLRLYCIEYSSCLFERMFGWFYNLFCLSCFMIETLDHVWVFSSVKLHLKVIMFKTILYIMGLLWKLFFVLSNNICLPEPCSINELIYICWLQILIFFHSRPMVKQWFWSNLSIRSYLEVSAPMFFSFPTQEMIFFLYPNGY